MLSESVDLKAEKKEFNRKFLSIIMPLLVSSIFSQCLTFIDQWMVSTLGSTAIAAVGAFILLSYMAVILAQEYI